MINSKDYRIECEITSKYYDGIVNRFVVRISSEDLWAKYIREWYPGGIVWSCRDSNVWPNLMKLSNKKEEKVFDFKDDELENIFDMYIRKEKLKKLDGSGNGT